MEHESSKSVEPYLAPYERAVERHGAGFDSLLWASPQTQAERFRVLCEAVNPAGKTLLDVGCGRADFLDYLIDAGAAPVRYFGIEGVAALADAAELRGAGARSHPPLQIIRADFVAHPSRMFVGADIVAFSGSLNTLDDAAFYQTVHHAYHAASEALVFNFLSSSALAGKDYLRWRTKDAVRRVASEICENVQMIERYLRGDCTACLRK